MEIQNLNGKCGIFCLYCYENSKEFIGYGKDLQTRKYSLYGSLRRGKGSKNLVRDFKECGKEGFDFYILEECGEEDLVVKLRKWLERRKPEYNTGYIKKIILNRIKK